MAKKRKARSKAPEAPTDTRITLGELYLEIQRHLFTYPMDLNKPVKYQGEGYLGERLDVGIGMRGIRLVYRI